MPAGGGQRASEQRRSSDGAPPSPSLLASLPQGIAFVALRPLWDEELFADAALNPNRVGGGGAPVLPPWYSPVDEGATRRVWQGITA